MGLFVHWKCSTNNHISGVKYYTSIQMNVIEVDKVKGRFNIQVKTDVICEAF
jgi:hypothetical protein